MEVRPRDRPHFHRQQAARSKHRSRRSGTLLNSHFELEGLRTSHRSLSVGSRRRSWQTRHGCLLLQRRQRDGSDLAAEERVRARRGDPHHGAGGERVQHGDQHRHAHFQSEHSLLGRRSQNGTVGIYSNLITSCMLLFEQNRHSDTTILRRNSIASGATESIQGVKYKIPSLPPSRLDGCKLIDLSYELVVRM